MRQKMSHCLSLMMGYRFILMNPIIHWKCAVPFMPLPDDILTLQHFLRLNYTSAVTIGADADNTALVALYRLPQTSTEEEALTGFELFISNVKQLKEHYA
ncbi:type III secretion chaperone protein SigE [Salmonella enterica subsp. enterica]|uniref:Type III secretion chaperone protein SigE n=1 Tax=Salmonella enterica I TaxID=59201 RepID=A0A447U5M2_SALET|nr:type III secretion chaperone protein SigE [Salmonella enterica subsp. enterica]